jgi:hypothetical protein
MCNATGNPRNMESTTPFSDSELPVKELRAALLASDLALEVDAEFTGKIRAGGDVRLATSHVLGRFQSALGSSREGPVVLVALAALQQREGNLQSVIKDAAIDLIESGEALAAYRPMDSAQRKNVARLLEQFADLLKQTRSID